MTNGDIRIIKKIAPQLNVGDNFERFIELANKTEIKASIKEEDKIEEIVKNKGEIWLFITKIYKPKIYREYGNNNKDTFDFIEVDVGVKAYFDNKIQFIREHSKEILKVVIDEIRNHQDFKKYNIPINFLKLTNVTLTRSNYIRYLFELKKIKTIKE